MKNFVTGSAFALLFLTALSQFPEIESERIFKSVSAWGIGLLVLAIICVAEAIKGSK